MVTDFPTITLRISVKKNHFSINTVKLEVPKADWHDLVDKLKLLKRYNPGLELRHVEKDGRVLPI